MWRNGALEAENFPFDQISDYLDEPDCWLGRDVHQPDFELLCHLAEELSPDQHGVEDAFERNERPKATRYSRHLFMTTYAIRYDAQTNGFLRSGRVSAFSTKRGFVTVRL